METPLKGTKKLIKTHSSSHSDPEVEEYILVVFWASRAQKACVGENHFSDKVKETQKWLTFLLWSFFTTYEPWNQDLKVASLPCSIPK